MENIDKRGIAMQTTKRRKRRIWLKILMWIIVAGIAFEGVMLLSVYLAGRRHWPSDKTDVAIVLGAKVNPNGSFSTVLGHRVDKALELYNNGTVQYIIPCGAQGTDEPKSEADAMADYLIAQGVPEDKVLREDKSLDTVQNIENAMAIMADRNLTTATIVTNEYHLTRAIWIANDLGLRANGAPAKGANFLKTQFLTQFRETLSWLNYWTGGLLGRISGLGSYS